MVFINHIIVRIFICIFSYTLNCLRDSEVESIKNKILGFNRGSFPALQTVQLRLKLERSYIMKAKIKI